MKRVFYLLLVAILLASTLTSLTRVFAAGTNLINNPSVETAVNNLPSGWTTNSWGTNTPTFTYDTTGNTGSRSLVVSLKNYTSGDAKWITGASAVSAGQTYTYSDYYKSDVSTELDLAYTDSSGKLSFVYLQTVAPSSTWKQNSVNFTIPAGMVSVSVYHIIYSNGTLQTDDFSLTSLDQTTSPTTPTTPTSPATPTTPTTPSDSNLIANSSFETANGTIPASWNKNNWGTNTPTFTYNTSGNTGSRSVTVSLSKATSGDAKWYANPVSVTAGSTYTYSDYYKSKVTTRVVAAMTNTSGTDSYKELKTAPAASTYTGYSDSLTIPTSIKSVTIYHLIDKIGSLTIDDVSLAPASNTPTPTPTPNPANPINNPSFETSSAGNPTGWQGDKWGTSNTTFSYIQNDGHTGTSSSKVTVSGYSSGDAKWSFTPITSLTPGSQYNFTAWYKTNTQPHVVAAYVDNAGVTRYLTLSNPLPGASAATTWQQYSTTFDLPINATSLTIYFLISSNGWLQTDDFSIAPFTPVGFNAPMISLTFDDGWSSIYTNGMPILQKYGYASTQYLISGTLNTPDYMTTAMVQSMKSSGHEIASHTVTHADLTKLTNAQLTTELANSQSSLRSLFGADVAQNFASPYGTYNANTLAYIKQYYQSHRSVDVGFNTKDNFNPYNILVQDIGTSTTPAEVSAWVAKAKAENSWLVLVYHAVTTSASADEYSITPANLDQQMAIIQASGIQVKTVNQALAIIKSQL